MSPSSDDLERFAIVNGLGESIVNPTKEQMRTFIDAIDATDVEHGAGWLQTDDGTALEWNGDGRLVFSRPSDDSDRHLLAVSREEAVELWIALAEGRLEEVEARAWQPGIGYVRSPEGEAEMRTWQLEQDRVFYDMLGAERQTERCRTDGCTRGAVGLSVFCRRHHFEMVWKRPCPFDD